MEMAYRERWQAEIAELQRILSGFDLKEECKWGKETGADELIVVSDVHDHAARLRSFELIAEVAGIRP